MQIHDISYGEGHSFFGYYDKSPWSHDLSRIGYLNASFCDRTPEADDEVRVVVRTLDADSEPRVVSSTRAWNWQQGCMLRWLGEASQLLFNDRDKDDFIARVVDEKGVELWRVPYAVYDLGADQDTTAAVNFSRLARLRPGYGYAGPKDEFADLPQPERDGLYIGSMREGRQELAVSIDQVARYEAPRFFKERVHWFNHATFSPGGGKLVFLHRCRLPVATRTTLSQFGSEPRNGGWKKAIRRGLGSVYRRITGRSFSGMFSRLFVVRTDGRGLRCLIDSGVCSHFGWRDEQTLIVWAVIEGKGPGYWFLDVNTGKAEPAGDGLPEEDGHCSFSRDGRWLLTDTYQAVEKQGCIVLRDMFEQQTHSIGRFYSAPGFSGELRCDFHPRLRHDNLEVCFDSAHTGKRGVYLVNVSTVTGDRLS